jgi:hypothetical protein
MMITWIKMTFEEDEIFREDDVEDEEGEVVGCDEENHVFDEPTNTIEIYQTFVNDPSKTHALPWKP